MRGPRSPLVFLLAALLGAAYADEPFEAHDKAHGRPELARVGTIGDLPPLESTLVVQVHADGAILVDGRETTLDGLSVFLLRLHETKREPAVLLRADARLPWKAMQMLLMLCAEQKVDRVFHAVLPETGDEEGALFWPLPRAQGPSAGLVPVRVGIVLGGHAATPAHLYRAAREAKPGSVDLKVGMAVPAAYVLRAADALFRAGVSWVYGYGTAIPKKAERASDLRPIVKSLLARGGDATSISVRFGEHELGDGEADPMPAVDRVRGGFAGSPSATPCPLPEEVPEEPAEEPEGSFTGHAANRAGKRTRAADENAVELGLAWLAAHQDLGGDGGWDCDGFMKHDPADDQCDGAGAAPHDVGVTGLALLAFLGAGYTDRGRPDENPYAKHVRAGLRSLMAAQADDGAFGPPETHAFMYNHAIATLAMCEMCWMTRNPRYKKPAQDGLNFLAAARNPYTGWRYRPRGGDSDTSVTVWCVMALKSGKFAGLEIDPDCFEGAREWIDHVTDPETGRVGYLVRGGPSDRPKGMGARWPVSATEAMTAAGILARIFLGEDPRSSRIIRKGVDLCAAKLPSWNPDTGSIDMDYWYFGTLALFQVGGRKWDIWTKAMGEAIVKHQHPNGSGARTGSWDPLDPWGTEGGRIYATALMTMSLEVYYRYDRVFGAK